jgi:hypothetical protein
MRIRFLAPLLILAVAPLAACNRTPPPCPQVSIIGDGSTVTKFREGTGRDLTDVTAQAQIVDVAVACDYDRRGVADRSRVAEFDYFVAVADPQRNILAKEVFRVGFRFPQNEQRVGTVEEIEPRIPLKARTDGVDYQIVVGFQLTPEEIEWNRTQRPR